MIMGLDLLPGIQQVVYRFRQLVYLEWFFQIGIGSKFVAIRFARFVALGSEQDNGNMTDFSIFLDSLTQLKSIRVYIE